LPEHDIKRRASELLQKGRLAEAIQEYKALLEQSKRPNPAIINLIGDIYIKQGDHAAGFSHFLKACKHYAGEGLYHNGIAVGKKILRLDKDQVEVYGTLGDLYARQGLGMDAVKFLNEFARRKEEANEFPAALAAFGQACETLTDCPELYIAYGEMLERVGREGEAGDNFRRVAEIYAERNMSAQAEHWTNRARSASGEEVAPEESANDTGVWDMMSLRDLGEKDAEEKPAAPAAPAKADKPVRPGSGVHPRSQWGIFDPGQNPAIPPPPPLPPEGSMPIAATDLAPPTGIAPLPTPAASAPPAPVADGPDLAVAPVKPSLDEATRISLVLEAPVTPETPPAPESRVTSSPLAPDATPEEMAIRDAAAEEDEKLLGGHKSPRASLSNLPGIIMPPSAKKKSDEPAHRPARRPYPPPLPEAEDSTSPVPTQPDAPTDQPLPGAVPVGGEPSEPGSRSRPDESLVMSSFSGLYAKPDAPDDAPTREQAIIIGDDTELVREGGDVNEVINDFREATSQILGEDDHQAHYDLGTTYLEMELFEEAASEFEMAASGTRFALVSQEMLGYCFLRQGHIERAVFELRKGLDLNGYEERAKVGLHYNLGIACGVLGHDADAIEAFRRVEALAPDFRDAKTRLERLSPGDV
jgi:tetratricopeptide (TPR) repeat protein